MLDKKEFTGVWIPRIVVEDKDLTWLQKAVYAEVACYNNCIMSNAHLSKVIGCSVRYISESISLLKKKGYIVEVKFDGKTRTLRSYVNHLKVEGGTTVLGRVEPQFHADRNPSSTIDNILDNKIDIVAPVGDDLGKKKVTPPAESVPFDVQAWVKSLMESDQRHIRLVGYYLGKYADHHLPTKKVANDELKKNLKPASYLVENFSKEDITKTLKYCEKNFGDVHWNLATVKKQITYVTAKKEN